MAKTEESTKKKKERLVLEVTEEFGERIEELRKLVQAGSKSEVIRDSLQLYEHLAELQREGWKFKLLSPQGEEETTRFFMYPKPPALQVS